MLAAPLDRSRSSQDLGNGRSEQGELLFVRHPAEARRALVVESMITLGKGGVRLGGVM